MGWIVRKEGVLYTVCILQTHSLEASCRLLVPNHDGRGAGGECPGGGGGEVEDGCELGCHAILKLLTATAGAVIASNILSVSNNRQAKPRLTVGIKCLVPYVPRHIVNCGTQ